MHSASAWNLPADAHLAVLVRLALAACGSGDAPAGPWNRDISGDPVHPNSDALIARLEPGNALHLDLGTSERAGRGRQRGRATVSGAAPPPSGRWG